MRQSLRVLIGGLALCAAMGTGGPARADREVHVVAVGRGQPSDDVYAAPDAFVIVDRPGQEIALVLLDDGDLTWHIDTTEGTLITEVIRSGPNPKDSAVLLSDIPMTGVQVSGLPLVYNPWGQDFRRLVDLLADRMKVTRLDSFQATYQSGDTPLRVDRVDTATVGLAQDYLADQVGTATDLPAVLQNWLANGPPQSSYSVAFDPDGLRLTGPDGVQHFPVLGDVPAILLPVTAVYAPDRRTIYGVTYGAEGNLYSVNVDSGQWKLVTSLNGYDAARALYDAASHSLVLTGAFSRPGDIVVLGLDGDRQSTFVPITAFPGLSDLSDFGNEYGPPLTPRAFADSWLLLEALGSPSSRYPDTGPFRIYAVDLTTKDVRLLRYRDE